MLKIKTSIPLRNDPNKILQKITKFWDRTTPAWQAIWGPHIHHGFFEAHESPELAQEKLIDKIAQLLEIKSGERILDVGCGMGGSSIYLAKKIQVEVTGISLSKVQIEIAEQQARRAAISGNFIIEDAHSLKSFADNTFDTIWSLESCEQFYDKNLFVQQAQRVLKADGQLMIATWCSDREEFTGDLAKKYKKICYAFDTPYMPTFEYYTQLLLKQRFSVTHLLDWSGYIKSSWQQGIARLRAYPTLKLIRYFGINELMFLYRVRLMQQFFQQGLIKYGVFIAKKL